MRSSAGRGAAHHHEFAQVVDEVGGGLLCARRCCAGDTSYSYIFTIAFDHGRNSGQSDSGTPSSSAITCTGSGSAYVGDQVDGRAVRAGVGDVVGEPVGEHGDPRPQPLDVAARERAGDQPAQSGCAPAARSPAASSRGSARTPASGSSGQRGAHIRPSVRVRSTAFAAACVNVSHMPKPSCHCTGARAPRSAKYGYGSATTSGEVSSRCRRAESSKRPGRGARESRPPQACAVVGRRVRARAA